MKSIGIASGALSLALTTAQLLSMEPAPRAGAGTAGLCGAADHGRQHGRQTRGRSWRGSTYLRDEPGGRRFFVNDLNGPLYILDKQTTDVHDYLDFNGLGGRPGLFPKFTFERNFATGLTNFMFDPDYARNGVFYTIHMEDPATSRIRSTDSPLRPPASTWPATRRRRQSRRRRSTAGSTARSC